MGYMIYCDEIKGFGWCFGSPAKALRKEEWLVNHGFTVHVKILKR